MPDRYCDRRVRANRLSVGCPQRLRFFSPLPADNIALFAKAQFRDKNLPYTAARLEKNLPGVPNNFVDDYRAAQALFLAVPFAPREVKEVRHYESVPFQLVWRSPKRGGSFAVVEQVKEGDRVLARKTLDLVLTRSRLEETKDCIRRELAVLHQAPDHAHLIQLRAAYTQENKTVIILSPWADWNLSDSFVKRESLAWWNETVKNGTAEHLLMNWAVCIAAALYAPHHRRPRNLCSNSPPQMSLHLEVIMLDGIQYVSADSLKENEILPSFFTLKLQNGRQRANDRMVNRF
ncbi:hypothetical protein BDZ88DRAFT_267061 [Geranomyces variabilis]|nr:hypothetical protein BDZ88DRAFT_267061 [Geranomyces variabilis]KAJ3134316.1 hypothetical protein HDU90_005182 [Geranomyces variabilis]